MNILFDNNKENISSLIIFQLEVFLGNIHIPFYSKCSLSNSNFQFHTAVMILGYIYIIDIQTPIDVGTAVEMFF